MYRRFLTLFILPAAIVSLLLTPRSGAARGDWVQVGPTGGYFVSFAPHPSRGNEVLAGGDDSSGIWKTEDGGDTWRLVSGALRNVTGWALARDAFDPDLIFATDIYGRHPVIRSTDGGETWTDVPDFPGPRRVGAVATDLTSPGVVYVGTGDPEYGFGNGVYRSADGGQTWQPAGLTGRIVNRLLALGDGVLLAGTPDGVWRSANGGATWQQASGLPAQAVTAMTRSADGSRAWVAIPGLLRSLYRSDDGGLTWSRLGQPLRYIFTLAVAPPPLDEQVLFYGTVLTGTGVRRSLDGGASWTPASSGLESQWTIGLGVAGDGTVFSGNLSNEGIFRSQNGGGAWQEANTDLNAYYATGITVDPADPATLYTTTLGPYAFGDNAGDPNATPTQTQRGQIDPVTGAIAWTVLPGVKAQTYGLSVAPDNPEKLLIGTFEQGVLFSTDGGATTTPVTSTGTSVTTAFDPDNPDIALAIVVDFNALTVTLWRTTNGGASWNAQPLAFGGIGLLPEAGTDRVWSWADDGVWLSLDNGLTWQRRGLDGLSIGSLAQHPLDPATLYAGTTGGDVYRSADDGITWSALPHPQWPQGAEVRALSTHPVAPNALLVGLNGAERRNATADVQRGGVWLALDDGARWLDLATPALSNDHVWGMVVTVEQGAPVVYVATYGGGVFRRALP